MRSLNQVYFLEQESGVEKNCYKISDSQLLGNVSFFILIYKIFANVKIYFVKIFFFTKFYAVVIYKHLSLPSKER